MPEQYDRLIRSRLRVLLSSRAKRFYPACIGIPPPPDRRTGRPLLYRYCVVVLLIVIFHVVVIFAIVVTVVIARIIGYRLSVIITVIDPLSFVVVSLPFIITIVNHPFIIIAAFFFIFHRSSFIIITTAVVAIIVIFIDVKFRFRSSFSLPPSLPLPPTLPLSTPTLPLTCFFSLPFFCHRSGRRGTGGGGRRKRTSDGARIAPTERVH